MVFRELPKELMDLRKIYGPYMENCRLRKDAPKEAKEAFEKAKKIAFEMGQQFQGVKMVFKEYPKELVELEKIYKPYLKDLRLKKDAPKEAIEALEKAKKILLEYGQ